MADTRAKLLAIATPALAILNWQIFMTPVDVSPRSGGEGGAQQTARSAVALKTQAVPPASYAETAARPLFRPDRRPLIAKAAAEPGPAAETPAQPSAAPPAEPPAAAEPVPPLPQGLRLVGIVTDPVNGRRALIRSGDAPVARSLAQGAVLEGWSVSDIGAASITLSAGGEMATLELYAAAASAAPDATHDKAR